MFSWPAVFIHTLVDSSASPCRVHWYHAIIGSVQCNSWVTTHDLQLLSFNGISLVCPWAPVQAAHLSRDFSGSLRLTVFHGNFLIHRKTRVLTPINSSVAHFHFGWGSVALLYCCRLYPLGLRASTSHVPFGAGCEILQETSIQPGNRISASLITESPRGHRVVLSSCFKLIEREGKGTALLLRILFKEVSSTMQILLIHRWGWPLDSLAMCSKFWGHVKTHCLLSLPENLKQLETPPSTYT